MRRQRDIDGNITYFNANDDKIEGFGFFSNIASKLATETTKKIVKDTVKKAGEKFIKDGSEKLGKKIMESGLKKIEDKVLTKNKNKVKDNSENKSDIITTNEIAGKKIVELLQEYNKKEQIKQPINKYADISQKFDELLLS